MQIAATILAGGKAKRLNGIAKGNLLLETQETIIAKLIRELELAGIQEIAISANSSTKYIHYNKIIIKDQQLNCGSLAGIVSSLNYFAPTQDAALFCPCDLPNITRKEFGRLLEQYQQNSTQIVYARTATNSHPLCCIIPTTYTKQLEQYLTTEKQSRLITIWQELHAAAITLPDENRFYNINTVAQLNTRL